MLTSKQYEEGYYTKKEAAIIGTTFSVVSITFSIVIIEEVGLGAYFLPFYATVVLAGLVLAFIMPRIYPLVGKKDEYIDGRPFTGDEEKLPEGYNSLSHGLENALTKANSNRSFVKMLSEGSEKRSRYVDWCHSGRYGIRNNCTNSCGIYKCLHNFR